MQRSASNHLPVAKFEIHWKHDTTHAFRIQKNELSIFPPHSGAEGNPRHMSSVSLREMEHCIFTNPIWEWSQWWRYWVAVTEYETLASWFIPNLQLFTGIWSKFRGTGETTACVIGCVLTDRALRICQSHLAVRKWMTYYLLWSEYETRLADWWKSCCICWPIMEVEMHGRVLGTYRYDWSISAYLPILVPI